jgi:hypothetical protein
LNPKDPDFEPRNTETTSAEREGFEPIDYDFVNSPNEPAKQQLMA